MEQGLYWYFSGCLASAAQNDTTGAGGYWKDYCAQLGYPQTYAELLERSYFSSIMYSEPSHTNPDSWQTFVQNFGEFVSNSLEGGSLVALTLKPQVGDAHSITLYGAEYADNGDILGVYVHDNNVGNPNLVYMEVVKETEVYYFPADKDMPELKGEYERLTLKGGGTTVNGWLITNVGSMDLRIMPEPATTTLSLLGLSLLLACRRRRRF